MGKHSRALCLTIGFFGLVSFIWLGLGLIIDRPLRAEVWTESIGVWIGMMAGYCAGYAGRGADDEREGRE